MNIDHSLGCSRGDTCSPPDSRLTSPVDDKNKRRLGTAGLFSPNPSAMNMNMFNMNMGPAVVDVLDPHFDMNDGLAQK